MFWGWDLYAKRAKYLDVQIVDTAFRIRSASSREWRKADTVLEGDTAVFEWFEAGVGGGRHGDLFVSKT